MTTPIIPLIPVTFEPSTGALVALTILALVALVCWVKRSVDRSHERWMDGLDDESR